MSASDDIQFDMSAALVGVMVVLFYLVYDETKFEQSPGEGTARIELFYIEDPLAAARFANFTWPAVISQGVEVDNQIYELDFNANFETYKFASNEVRCRLDDSVQAVWQVNTTEPTLKEPRGYQGSSVAGDVALEDAIDAQVEWTSSSGPNDGYIVALSPLPDPWSTFVSEDEFRSFLPSEVLTGDSLLPSAPGAVGLSEFSWFEVDSNAGIALGHGSFRFYGYLLAPDTGGSTVFSNKNPTAAMDPEVLRGILRHPLAQSIKCSLSGQTVHAAQEISLHFDPPGCGVMGSCTSGFQNIRLLGLRYRTPQGRQWVTWDFSQGALEGVKFIPNATPNADGTYTLAGATRIAVELN